MPRRPHSLACIAALALAVPACDRADDAAPDLFACDAPVTCDIGWNILVPRDLVVCAGEAILADKPGVLLEAETVDPGTMQHGRIVILAGDGTALVQTRERSCGADCDDSAWGPVADVQRCDVDFDAAILAGCEMCTDDTCLECDWRLADALTNCAPATATCDDLP